jgi:hypothetical protein
MKKANEKKEPHRARVRASAHEGPMDASRGAVEAQLEELKEKLLAPIVRSVGNTMLVSELRWVANEAAALAWFTVCPILVLPLLLEEKIRAALERWERQHQLLECRVRSAECGITGTQGHPRLQAV